MVTHGVKAMTEKLFEAALQEVAVEDLLVLALQRDRLIWVSEVVLEQIDP